MARLDRLGPAKEVAQVGAAIGREFSHAQLAAVTHKTKAELQSAVDRPVAAGLLLRQGTPPHAVYLFKHALVRDVAYSTLLREPRRALHAGIAKMLEGQFSEVVENQRGRPATMIEKVAACGKCNCHIEDLRSYPSVSAMNPSRHANAAMGISRPG
jgi:predicted ATPase